MEALGQWDLCVIGHVTKDVIRIPGRDTKVMAGGTVTYASAALRALGRSVTVITRAAPADRAALLRPMEERGVDVCAFDSAQTTVFENSYEGADLAVRHQRVDGVAEPFAPEHVCVSARAYQLGPLTAAEMDAAFVAAVAETGALVGLDVQGYTRAIVDGAVRQVAPADLSAVLRWVHVLKADDSEACVVTGCTDVYEAARALQRLGPREVLITFADRGSLLLDPHGEFHRIPAFPPAGHETVDATGCGDTYFAGYLHHRLDSTDWVAAARFAAAVSSLKCERYGPFQGSEASVHERAALQVTPKHHAAVDSSSVAPPPPVS